MGECEIPRQGTLMHMFDLVGYELYKVGNQYDVDFARRPSSR
jgi:hypothetical protein